MRSSRLISGAELIHCRLNVGQTKAPLDRRLGVESSGMTPGLMRLVCRTALELPYQQSQRLLNDTLGFTPCSAREIERIAKEHGQRIEKSLPVHFHSIEVELGIPTIPGAEDNPSEALNGNTPPVALL